MDEACVGVDRTRIWRSSTTDRCTSKGDRRLRLLLPQVPYSVSLLERFLFGLPRRHRQIFLGLAPCSSEETATRRKRPRSFLNVAFIYRGLPVGTVLVSLDQNCRFGRGRRHLQMHLANRHEGSVYNLVRIQGLQF